MEATMQLLTLVALILWGLALFREWRQVSQLAPDYVDSASRMHPLPPGWPHVPDRALLDGFEGKAGLVRWRWEPTRGRITFGRAYTVGRGERGWAVGFVEPGAAGVRWRHTGDSLLSGFFLLGVLGTIGLGLVEGDWMGLVGIPVLAMCVGIMRMVMMFNARRTLERALLVSLTRALREHLSAAGEERATRNAEAPA